MKTLSGLPRRIFSVSSSLRFRFSNRRETSSVPRMTRLRPKQMVQTGSALTSPTRSMPRTRTIIFYGREVSQSCAEIQGCVHAGPWARCCGHAKALKYRSADIFRRVRGLFKAPKTCQTCKVIHHTLLHEVVSPIENGRSKLYAKTFLKYNPYILNEKFDMQNIITSCRVGEGGRCEKKLTRLKPQESDFILGRRTTYSLWAPVAL